MYVCTKKLPQHTQERAKGVMKANGNRHTKKCEENLNKNRIRKGANQTEIWNYRKNVYK